MSIHGLAVAAPVGSDSLAVLCIVLLQDGSERGLPDSKDLDDGTSKFLNPMNVSADESQNDGQME